MTVDGAQFASEEVMSLCRVKTELISRTNEIMGELVRLIEEERQAVAKGELYSVQGIDRRIERCFVEKDRAFDTLQKHIKEHGC